jgi:hypothetical protein
MLKSWCLSQLSFAFWSLTSNLSGLSSFGLGYQKVEIQQARGYASGIWILSNSSLYSFSVIDNCSQAITLRISFGARSWVCSIVYASSIPSTRQPFWDYLISLRNRCNAPWLFVGDFNEILLPPEVSGALFVRIGLLPLIMFSGPVTCLIDLGWW